MSEFTPTTDEVRDSLVYLNKYHAKQHGDVDLMVVGSETAAQFDRMIAEVERAATEKALTEAAGQMPFPVDPYGSFDHESLRAAFVQNTNWLRDRAEAWRRNEGEKE